MYTTNITHNNTGDHSFNTFLNKVFIWMGVGMSITAIMSYLFATTPYLLLLLENTTGITSIGYVIMFAPIGFVLLMSFKFKRLSYIAILILFLLYAATMGVSLTFIFIIYTSESIFNIFIVACLMFASMGVLGYLTKTDLTKKGSFFVMALVGIIIASLINMFLKSDPLSYVISIISVIVFCGLTAWDIEKLKHLSEDLEIDTLTKSKLEILGALTLYLDFINLFFALLRLFANKKNI